MARAQSAGQHCMPAAANVCEGRCCCYQSFVMTGLTPGTLSNVSDWICWVSLGAVCLWPPWLAVCLTMKVSDHSMAGQQGDPALHLAALNLSPNNCLAASKVLLGDRPKAARGSAGSTCCHHRAAVGSYSCRLSCSVTG